MMSFPKFIREEHSGQRIRDSPFPPLKIEHRYKGVYERAGFDVNLDAMKSPKDNKSIRSLPKNHTRQFSKSGSSTPSLGQRKSPSTAFSSSPQLPYKKSPARKAPYDSYDPRNGQQNPRNASQPSLHSGGYKPDKVINFQDGVPPRINPYEPAYHENNPYEKNTPDRPNPYESARPANPDRPANTDRPNPYESARRANPYDQPNRAPYDQPNRAPYDQPAPYEPAGPAGPANPYDRPTDPKKRFDPRRAHTEDRRKNSIEQQNSQNPQNAQNTYDYNYQQPYDYYRPESEHTYNNGAYKADYSSSKSDSTNSHRSTADSGPEKMDSQVTSPSSSEAPYRGLDRKQDYPDDLGNDMSMAHNKNIKNLSLNLGPSTDYHNFLSTGQQKTVRNSQLSMVSSIISKDSVYEDEEDKEVQRELERQLESLKEGKQVEPVREPVTEPLTEPVPVIRVEEDLNSVPTFKIEEPNVPTFEITQEQPEKPRFEQPKLVEQHTFENPHIPRESVYPDEEQRYDHTNETYDNDTTYAKPEPYQPSPSMTPRNFTGDLEYDSPVFPHDKQETAKSYEPENVPHDPIAPPSFAYPQDITLDGGSFISPRKSFNVTSQYRTVAFESVPETPNDIAPDAYARPLSSELHQVEADLNNMHFAADEGYDQEYMEGSPIRPLRTSQTRPLNAPPQPDFDRPRITEPPVAKHLPGQGPCRTCRREVFPNAKGAQKAIFSKTGELSGQWHRMCFTCNYEGCNVAFNKNVQCYVFSDAPYCGHHYHSLNNTLCEHCSIGIEGECIENELAQKWHLACLRCYKCNNSIKQDYYLMNGSIVCERDAMNIINGLDTLQGNMLSASDKIERRRTRLLFVD